MKIIPVALPIQNMPAAGLKQAPNATEDHSFKQLFDQAIEKLNGTQIKSDQIIQKFLTGEVNDIHTVMLALGEARLSMQLAVEVRNKLVEAYQEISRMQV